MKSAAFMKAENWGSREKRPFCTQNVLVYHRNYTISFSIQNYSFQ